MALGVVEGERRLRPVRSPAAGDGQVTAQVPCGEVRKVVDPLVGPQQVRGELVWLEVAARGRVRVDALALCATPSPSPEPTPEPTPSPSPSPTPELTATPGVTDSPTPLITPSLIDLPTVLPPAVAADLGPALAGIAMYVLMAAVLTLKPAGLFPARG